MTYATRADLEALWGAEEVAQRESMLDAGAVDRALVDADAEINSYALTRYPVPLNPVPANIVRHAAIIARYYLLGDAATERARNDYTDTRAYLRDVQAGRAQLEGTAPLAAAAPASTVEMVSGRSKVFHGGLR